MRGARRVRALASGRHSARTAIAPTRSTRPAACASWRSCGPTRC